MTTSKTGDPVDRCHDCGARVGGAVGKRMIVDHGQVFCPPCFHGSGTPGHPVVCDGCGDGFASANQIYALEGDRRALCQDCFFTRHGPLSAWSVERIGHQVGDIRDVSYPDGTLRTEWYDGARWTVLCTDSLDENKRLVAEKEKPCDCRAAYPVSGRHLMRCPNYKVPTCSVCGDPEHEGMPHWGCRSKEREESAEQQCITCEAAPESPVICDRCREPQAAAEWTVRGYPNPLCWSCYLEKREQAERFGEDPGPVPDRLALEHARAENEKLRKTIKYLTQVDPERGETIVERLTRERDEWRDRCLELELQLAKASISTVRSIAWLSDASNRRRDRMLAKVFGTASVEEGE